VEKSPDQSAAGDGAMPTMSLQGGRRVLLVVPGLAGHPRKVGLDSFISTEHHSWDPLAGEIVFSGFVWSVCQSLCSPTSPRLGPREMDVPSFHRSWISLRFRKRHSGRDGCIVTRIFRSPCDLAAVQTWRLIWNTFLVAVGWTLWRSFGGCWSILNDGMAFYLAAGGYFPIGQAFGSR
jgi:hypothetical protein